MLGWELQTHYRNWLGKCKGAERSPRPALLCWEVFGVHYWGSCSAKETIIVYAFLRDGFACWKKIRSLWAAGRGSQMDLVSWGGERRSVWSLLSKRRRILLCHRWEPHCAAPAADPPQHTRHVTLTHGLHISHIYVWVYFYFLTSFLTFTVHAFHFLFFFVHCKAPKHQGTFPHMWKPNSAFWFEEMGRTKILRLINLNNASKHLDTATPSVYMLLSSYAIVNVSDIVKPREIHKFTQVNASLGRQRNFLQSEVGGWDWRWINL